MHYVKRWRDADISHPIPKKKKERKKIPPPLNDFTDYISLEL